jgi:hypothetical protein
MSAAKTGVAKLNAMAAEITNFLIYLSDHLETSPIIDARRD